jgi:thiamine-monophosphate kinase
MLHAGAANRETGTDGALGEAACVERHRRPEPRLRLGVAVSRARAATAAMDLSDGLADALTQIASASGVGVRVDAESVPIEPGARAWWTSRGVDPLLAAVRGGDDYELLFAVAPRRRGALRSVTRHVASPALTKIGVFTKDPRERLIVRGTEEVEIPGGFEHFAS